MCIWCQVMIWKRIYFCNLPKSVFQSLCHFVPLEAKLSDRQREYSNSLYSAVYPIIFCENLYANMIYQVAQLAQYIHRKKTTVKHVRRFKVIADCRVASSYPLVIFFFHAAHYFPLQLRIETFAYAPPAFVCLMDAHKTNP